jgi:hypothetical protein
LCLYGPVYIGTGGGLGLHIVDYHLGGRMPAARVVLEVHAKSLVESDLITPGFKASGVLPYEIGRP